MSDMTGIQIAAELLVILCTGFSYAASEETAQAAGIKGFVMKTLAKREAPT